MKQQIPVSAGTAEKKDISRDQLKNSLQSHLFLIE
jgi:hypothetical protein